MDDGNARSLRLLGGQITVRLAKNAHFSRITGVNAAEYFHQGGFSSPVFAQQSHNFTRLQLKIDMIQRIYAGKAFANPLHGDDGFFHLLIPRL
ncbi:hypothetical protein DSECCO2_550380 [anaerobic digester metagenome]